MQNIGIYIIGDEILSGRRQDAHLKFVIEALKTRGLQLNWANYLGDSPEQITSLLTSSMALSKKNGDVVFSFGGIGATPDDHTRQCAADAAGVPIERHADAVANIEAQYGEGAYPKRVLMADFPQGAKLIPNPINRVAGFSINQHYFVPGFPEMAHPMVAWVLDTYYAHLFHQIAFLEHSIIIENGLESGLIDLMNAVIAQFDVKVFSLPKLKPNPRVELGAKGSPDKVLSAMAALKAGVEDLGYSWQDVKF